MMSSSGATTCGTTCATSCVVVPQVVAPDFFLDDTLMYIIAIVIVMSL